ncbi:MAG: DUF262 domain-containing protein [Acidobacteria bacterium]|nr:DUF262 domain-containing protein [Acidobacteriota bacterium]
MAKTNLLNTHTQSFLDLVGNGRVYRVPPYQRDYAWQEEQWEDLWNDILELRRDPDGRHYMGAMVVEAQSDRQFQIIDGQQRLATLTVLALVVIQKLESLATANHEPSKNRDRAQALRHRFVGEKDPASLLESSKLSLNAADDPFFQDYIVQLRPPRNPRTLPKSSRLLSECFQYFSARLDDVAEIKTDGLKLAELLSEVVARQLIFILITVDDELNAYTVFETLNARGIELSSTDLLKNYIFSLVRVESDRSALQRRWQSMIGTVGQERFPEFLRYHLQCTHARVRSRTVFKLIRREVADDRGVFELIGKLEARAELFSALTEPTHSLWIEHPDARAPIVELNLFRVGQATPLLFAAWEKLDRQSFVKVLELVSGLSFRYKVSGLNPNALEPVYHKAAKELLEGRESEPARVFQLVRSAYVADQKFEQDFARFEIDTDGQSKKLAKYILSRIESDRAGHAIDPSTDPATIEHILPENPSDEWAGAFPAEHWAGAVYRLGNLTLLEAAANRQVGNAAYAEKVSEFARSRYVMTRDISLMAPEEWTLALLDRRQADFARRAVHLWRSRYV